MTEINLAVIKKTQDILGKFVKKPVLSEKLLKKPPFKFLHDVINAVIKNTGFLNGLYSAEELQSDNIKDRDAKVAFLQKTIDVVKLATKENLTVRPSKVVAGLEPEKTNELLQAIGKAIQNKVDSAEAVQAVKTGQIAAPTEKKKTTKKDAKTTSKTKSTNAENKEIKSKPSETKKVANDSNVKRQSSKEAEAKGLKRRDSKENNGKKVERKSSISASSPKKKTEEIKTKEKVSNQVDKKNENDINKEAGELKSKDDKRTEKEDKNPPENEQPKEIINNVDSSNNNSNTKNTENIVADNKTIKTTSEAINNNSELNLSDKIHKQDIELNDNDIKKAEEIKDNDEMPTDATENQTNKILEKSKQTDKKSSDRMDKPKEETKKEDTELDKLTKTATKKSITKSMSINEENLQKMQPVRPTTALRSAAVRPVSARPGAPRRKDRNVKILEIENFGREINDNANTNKTNFAKELVDDGENLITIDDNILPEETPQVTAANTQKLDIDESKQGHLVQQILETQTVFSKIENEAKKDSARANDVTSKSMVERQLSAKKMSFLRESIQKLTRYITPLGKLMEYFQEDVDAMQIELSMWQNTYGALEMEIKNEQGLTEKLLEPFKYQLVGIENNIKDYREQINNLTANILQNEEKIFKLIVDL